MQDIHLARPGRSLDRDTTANDNHGPVTTINRNAPCPCGSGKKHKKCCGAVPTTPRTFPVSEAVHELTRKLIRYSARTRSAEDIALGRVLYFGDRLDKAPRAVVERFLDTQTCVVNFTSFMLHDFGWGVEPTVLERFLEDDGVRLTPTERRYLEAVARTHIGLYEIEEVVLDQGVRLRDLLESETVWVRERAATHYVARWDILGARIVRDPDGDATFVADLYPFLQQHKALVLKGLRRFLRLGKRRVEPEAMLEDLKRLAPFFFQAWWDMVACPPIPKMTNFDGHKLVWTKTAFDVLDRQALDRELQRIPEFEMDEPHQWTWFRDERDERRVLGHVEFREEMLVLETNSLERAERGRELLESRVGALLRYRLQHSEDTRARLDRQRDEGTDSEPAAAQLEPELQQRMRRELLDKHYRAWPDIPVPALDGRTPRHAARLKTQRQRVVDLLKEFENSEAHEVLQGREAYDFGWMWDELGLERPRVDDDPALA